MVGGNETRLKSRLTAFSRPAEIVFAKDRANLVHYTYPPRPRLSGRPVGEEVFGSEAEAVRGDHLNALVREGANHVAISIGSPWFYAGGVASRHCHHRHADCAIASRHASRARSGTANAVLE